MILEIGNAVRHHKNGGDKTLVWFGGLHEPFLNPAFLPAGWNCLSLIDKRFDWYSQGISGIDGGFEGAVSFLNGLLASQTTVFAGQSSGGYGALRFCHAVGGSLCVALAPQTKNLIVDGYKMPPVDVVALDDIYLSAPPAFQTLIHVSRSEDESKTGGRWDDWRQIESFLNMPQVTIARHPFDVHALSLKLSDQQRFYKTIVGSIAMYI